MPDWFWHLAGTKPHKQFLSRQASGIHSFTSPSTACLGGEGRLLLFCCSDSSGLLFLKVVKHYIRKDLGKNRKYKISAL